MIHRYCEKTGTSNFQSKNERTNCTVTPPHSSPSLKSRSSSVFTLTAPAQSATATRTCVSCHGGIWCRPTTSSRFVFGAHTTRGQFLLYDSIIVIKGDSNENCYDAAQV